MKNAALALAGNPELIEMQMQQHNEIVAGLQAQNRELRQQLAILREKFASSEGLIEETEVARLTFALRHLEEIVATEDLRKPLTLHQLWENDQHARLALELFAIMRGRATSRPLCQRCRENDCEGCEPENSIDRIINRREVAVFEGRMGAR